MLVIRLQRTGRSGHAQFRIVVQDARQTPTSGRVVASLGNYDPHSKEFNIDTEKVKAYLANGAQPSDRVALLLKKNGVKLPVWVKLPAKKKSAIKNVEKLRKNRPAGAPEPQKPAEAAPAVEVTTTEAAPSEDKATTEVENQDVVEAEAAAEKSPVEEGTSKEEPAPAEPEAEPVPSEPEESPAPLPSESEPDVESTTDIPKESAESEPTKDSKTDKSAL